MCLVALLPTADNNNQSFFFLSDSSQSSEILSTQSFIQHLSTHWIWYVNDGLFIVPCLIGETNKQIHNFNTKLKEGRIEKNT